MTIVIALKYFRFIYNETNLSIIMTNKTIIKQEL